MLKVLIALGGSNIRKEQITDFLWPDADGDMAHKSFATTLHRLRQLLGEKQTIRLHEGRLTIDDRYCWVDALFILKRAAELDQHWPVPPDPEVLRNAENIIALYQGPFLEGDPGEAWVDNFQNRVQRRCLKLLGRFGKYLEQQGEWERAIICYEKAIAIDPLAEPFYLYLMECYHHLGWSGEIVRTYRQCRQTVMDALGIEPSARLKDTFDLLISDSP